MARVETIICLECHERKQTIVAGHISDYICGDCKRIKAEQKRKEYFDKLHQLSIEERIAKIEEWIYEHSQVNHHSTNNMIY